MTLTYSRPARSLMRALAMSAAFFIAPLSFAQSTPIPKDEASLSTSDTKHVFTIAPNDHVIGDEAAPNVLIVYASVVCGHCGQWFSHEYSIIKEELIDTGELKLIFREFPTAPGNIAVIGFQLANCAPEEDFFDLILHQMKNQEKTFAALKDGTAKEYFIDMAKLSGLDGEEEMSVCFDNKEGMARIENSMKRAQAAEVNAVPALIFNEELMKGGTQAKHILAALGKDTSHLEEPKPGHSHD